MNTKLTLSINKSVTERAKKYARRKKTSLSKLVENQLDKLTTEEKESNITPLVKSLSGVISTDAADKRKKGYVKFLKKKYQ
jgi:hypothetical protein